MFVVVKLLSHVWLFCDPMECSILRSSVHGISQARILEWVAISFRRGSSRPRIERVSPALACALSLSRVWLFVTSWTVALHWQGDSLPLSHQGNPTRVQPQLDPGIPLGGQRWLKDRKAERTEAWSNWFTQKANKICDTKLALTMEATGALSNSWRCPALGTFLSGS